MYYNQVRVSRSQALSCSRFVQQEDIFYPFITSSEHLEAQSKLRLPRQTKADQHTRAREVLDNFNLSKVADTRIGHAVEGKAGLSGGERKRLSVATEMISSPPLLFADEPTTGLDSSMAEVVIKKLKDLTLRGHCVACTIHQPSSTVRVSGCLNAAFPKVRRFNSDGRRERIVRWRYDGCSEMV